MVCYNIMKHCKFVSSDYIEYVGQSLGGYTTATLGKAVVGD